MEKILLKSKEQFDSFVNDNTGYQPYYGNVRSWLSEPTSYPCVLSWDIEYNGNGPDRLIGDFVYPDDFDEQVSDKSDVDKIYNFIKKENENPYYDDNAYSERCEGYRQIMKFIEDNIYRNEK